MIWKMKYSRAALEAAMLAGILLSFSQASMAGGRAQVSGAAAGPRGSTGAASEAAARLDKKQFRNVQVSVENGIATLTGTVDLYEYKADAGKRILRAKSVNAVRNLIEVAGPTVPDRQLEAKLVEKLAYDRVGYGNAFNAITIGVDHGVVTVGGHARTDVDKDSALDLVSTYPGVKDVAGEIEVDPASPLDDRIRMAVARAVYGYTSLNKYAIDPAKPIRISVQNGHVELYGVVDSQADKETAFIRANGVSGVFSVKNYLQVAGQPEETQK